MKTKLFIGKRIKELRKNNKFSQEKLAEKAEINPKYLSRIELGMENPTLDLFMKLAAALEVEMWEMFDYGPEVSTKMMRQTICDLAKEADPEKVRLALKIVRAAVR